MIEETAPRDARGPAEPGQAPSPGDTSGPPRPTAIWHVITTVWALTVLLLAASGHPFASSAMLVLFGGMLGLIWCFQLARVLLDREARGRLTPRAAVGWAIYPVTAILLSGLLFPTWMRILRMLESELALLRLVGQA